jgi:chemotaxis protein methyltransferase CheR
MFVRKPVVPVWLAKDESTESKLSHSRKVQARSRHGGNVLMRKRSPVGAYIRLNAWLWNRLPSALRDTKLVHQYGEFLHHVVSRHADRRQFIGTFFFRNRPQLELMRRLADRKAASSTLDITILGCSIGAEVYSVLSTIRSARPDLRVRACAVDSSADVLKVAREAVYTSQVSEFAGATIFERMTETEFAEVFESDGGAARVRSWVREGIRWHLGDAADPHLMHLIAPQDMVVANNFLCHMAPAQAENCLRNIGDIVRPGGHLFVTGVDLDVRAKVARDLGWRPVLDLIEEIHEGDPSVRRDWPCAWWGLEPLNKNRADWQLRYASAFRLNENI